jgi:uncharacterized Zn finger protein
MSNLYTSFNFNNKVLPKKPTVVDELVSVMSQYNNDLRIIDKDNLSEEEDRLIYLLTRAVKKHLESRFMDQPLTDQLKIEIKQEVAQILNALRQLKPIDNKLKWEFTSDKYANTVTLRAFIDD